MTIQWKKEALAKVLSCKFCKICKNAYFEEHLKTTSVFEKYSWKACEKQKKTVASTTD